MKTKITKPYLLLPVDKTKPEEKLHFYIGGKKVQEVDIHFGQSETSFYVPVDFSDYLGHELEIVCDNQEISLEEMVWKGDRDSQPYPFHPYIHFTPQMGWMNDPNGLVYADGIYHLFYQWNPYGVTWGNMHWGHAESRDLIHWNHRDTAIRPDAYGTAFSGSGFVDEKNVVGYGENALLFYYTAAGGTNQWSADAGNRFTQRLKISTDHGKTLQDYGWTILPHIAGENRDPKVFYHKESAAYIMALYLEENTFAIYRSEDLAHWEETQRLSLEGMCECPDLFELSVDNDPDKKKWVFWSADGYYVIGSFDGYRFLQESEKKCAYATKLAYAAQTYSGVTDRVISVAWLRTEDDRGNYRGIMSFPAELFLRKNELQYTLGLYPVQELSNARKQIGEITGLEWKQEIAISEGALDIEIIFDGQNRSGVTLLWGGKSLDINTSSLYSLRLLADVGILEYYGDDGLLYGAVELPQELWNQSIVVEAKDASMKWYQLK
jgi:sucrose-6-phosphate hydrolase SacC (GH32 family)